MIDFYGGAGTYASWPLRTRSYALLTTPVNILDWESAYAFAPTEAALAELQIPTLVIRGGASHPAVQRANALLSECLGNAELATVDTAAHFMIATHPNEVARLIARHVYRAEPGQISAMLQSANDRLIDKFRAVRHFEVTGTGQTRWVDPIGAYCRCHQGSR